MKFISNFFKNREAKAKAKALQDLLGTLNNSENYRHSQSEMPLKRTRSSTNWDEFFMQLSKEELAGTMLSPQLILCCQVVSMATRLVEGLPTAAKSLLADDIEISEFGNGLGAVRFPLNDGRDIIQFVKLLGQGTYGTDRLVIKNGIALRLPVSDRQLLRQALGLPQILTVGRKNQVGQETFIWW